ncbi:MAG: pyruvate flavodoxin/ferredoxin oxidoreductase [Desulfosarcinaceae bacterium]|nr:pyruvate flavodoxin/ferredoxin oxidoreductase [Desulfosarcinaceae bacterium]
MAMQFMEGNEAIARGAVAAGCRFFAGYPITPATTVYNNMLRLLPPLGGICLQGEDEIASIGFCLGAAMTGAKALTATSGPGISLYSEQISFAIGSEIPLVIVNIQRLGPSTGSATRGADGDIQFMQWGNSGGQPVIVLAPVDIRDCYTLTAHAFNLAERFRCPVFLAANKEIAMTRESVDLDRLPLPAPVERRTADARNPFLPFATADGELVPRFLPIGGQRLVRQTSSTHGPDGYITTDAGIIDAMQKRLRAKIHSAADALALYDADIDPAADTLVIAYGVSARAVRKAVAARREQGRKLSLLVLKTLWPVPEGLLRENLAAHRRAVVVEMNLGQYVREIERLAGATRVDFFGQMDGNLLHPRRIAKAL